MARTRGTRMQYRCSFCGKDQGQVQRLIAGPGGVYICDECVDLCHDIIEEEKTSRLAASETGAARHEYPGSVKAFFAGLPTASDSGESGALYPSAHIEFIGRSTRPQHVFLLGRDPTGIAVRDLEADGGGVHFYPWSSIFRLTP